MRTLAIDIETYSSVDLVKSGAYAYACAPDFKILLFAYAFDDEPVKVIDIAGGERIAETVKKAINDDGITKTAFNAQFERVCLSRHLNIKLKPESWQCTAAQAATLGLPHSLEDVGKVLGLELQKIKEGKDLIRLFCKPNKNGERNLPEDYFDKWQRFKEYCARDVAVEREIRRRLSKYVLPEIERKVYILDQYINDRGVRADMELVRNAMECDRRCSENAFEQARRITGIENPNSVSQLKQWLYENGIETESLSKKNVSQLIAETNGNVEKLLKLRLQLAKTSIKKYEAIMRSACPDGRVRGLLQYYGANRTGRWAGRLVQVQNLPQNHMKDLTLARELVKNGQFDDVDLLYESTPVVLSELIRTAFIPSPNHRFIVADFSAIEARVVAWLAGEEWVLETFRKGKGIYEATAARMYNVPEETIVKGNPNYEYRQKGKQATLACGYGGGVGALKAMGAEMPDEDMLELVQAWRYANPNIVKFWRYIEKAAKRSISEKTSVTVGRIQICCQNDFMFITLPSGRNLSYVKPILESDEKTGRECITYEGIEQKSWTRLKTYGGKLVENIVQATARDLLAEAMLRISKAGYNIVMHCHDEVVTEVEYGFGSVEEVCDIMSKPPEWAKDLPLTAEGFECEYYRK